MTTHFRVRHCFAALTALGFAACGVPDFSGFDQDASAGSGGTGALPDAGGAGGAAGTAGSAGAGGMSGSAGSAGSGGGPATCKSSSDCSAPAPVCDTTASSCVECLPSEDVCGPGTYCVGTNCVVGCSDDTDCGGTLTCDVPNHVCQGCTTDTDCPSGTLCNTATTKCEPGCTTSATCPAGFDCCSSKCENTETSVAHCGACDQPCVAVHAPAVCTAGVCGAGKCENGFYDCDGSVVGCETAEDVDNCGACGAACSSDHGTPSCSSGQCSIQCTPGYLNCDGNAQLNGCEVDIGSDPYNCGGCGSSFACPPSAPNCSNGKCGSGCGAQFSDCDGNAANGCETNIQTSALHCGGCNNPCEASDQYCNAGTCAPCNSGKSDCDKNGANGCEVSTMTDPANCGACGQSCGSDGTCGCAANQCSGGTVYFSENFSDNGKGWTLAGEWAIGPTQSSSGQEQGGPDPAMDHSSTADNGVAGIVLGGNYAKTTHAAHYLTSPAVDLSGAGTVKLTFWRWLNCDYDPFVTDTVEVYNGSSWTTVWSSTSAGKNFITDLSWSRQEIDVTAYKNAAFQVRFGHATGKQGNLLPWAMSGWNVDDVSLSSATCN